MKRRDSIVLVVLGVFLWLLIAAFDTLAFPTQSFLDLLILGVPGYQLLFRVAILALFTSSGVLFSRAPSAKRTNAEDSKESDEVYKTILNNLPVGVYRTTLSGKILKANHRFAEILGYRNVEELQDVNLNEAYMDKSDRQAHLDRLRDSPVFAEFEIRRKDGRTVWVRDYPKATMNKDSSIAYVDGVYVEAHGIEAIIRDIREHKRLQNMKDHFIVAVTHELRTPLVSIKGYVDHIMAKEPNLSPGLKSKIEVVRRNTDRLLELTNDLLNIQDMETGQLPFKLETLNLQEVLAECVEEIQPLIGDKKQEIRLEIPGKALPVVGDRVRVNEVLMNLLSNANKFSPVGGSILLRVEEDASTVTISVTDNGIGIDRNDLDRVFEPFAAIEKPTYFKGSGLGLSLAKKLVEAQSGKIWATSLGKGAGTTFAFTLPKSNEELVSIHG